MEKQVTLNEIFLSIKELSDHYEDGNLTEEQKKMFERAIRYALTTIESGGNNND